MEVVIWLIYLFLNIFVHCHGTSYSLKHAMKWTVLSGKCCQTPLSCEMPPPLEMNGKKSCKLQASYGSTLCYSHWVQVALRKYEHMRLTAQSCSSEKRSPKAQDANLDKIYFVLVKCILVTGVTQTIKKSSYSRPNPKPTFEFKKWKSSYISLFK